MLVEITNDYWPVRVNGTIQSIWQDTGRLEWHAQWSRLAVSVATTTRAKTISWTIRRKRSRLRRMRSVKPNCLRDKSSVSSVASRLCSCRRRTCVYARSRSRLRLLRNSLRGTSKSSLSLSWFVGTSGCRHARLTIAAILIGQRNWSRTIMLSIITIIINFIFSCFLVILIEEKRYLDFVNQSIKSIIFLCQDFFKESQ